MKHQDDDLHLEPADPHIAIGAIVALLTIFGLGVGIYELVSFILEWA